MTTVVALDVPTTAPVGAAAQAAFDRTILAVARQLGVVAPDAPPDHGGPHLALTLPPEANVGAALRRLAAAMLEFEGLCAPLGARAVVHNGVVFRTENNGNVSYVGSAIRSVQSVLKRAPAIVGMLATQDFAGFAAKMAQVISFLPMSGGGVDGLSAIHFVDPVEAIPRKSSDKFPAADPELLKFLKERLALDLGPFASVLVDTALRTASTATQLIAELGREVDDASARQRFEADARAYVKSRVKA